MIQNSTCGKYVNQDNAYEWLICVSFLSSYDVYIYICIENR